MSTRTKPGSALALRPRYLRIPLSRLGASVGLAPDYVQALSSFIPAVAVGQGGAPFTDFGIRFFIGRHPIPVIEAAERFRPIGGFRAVALARRLDQKSRIVVQVWPPEILALHPKIAVQDALLSSLILGLDTTSASSQLKRWHQMLDKNSCDEIFPDCRSKKAFEKNFGVNRRGSTQLPEPKISLFAQIDMLGEGGDDE